MKYLVLLFLFFLFLSSCAEYPKRKIYKRAIDEIRTSTVFEDNVTRSDNRVAFDVCGYNFPNFQLTSVRLDTFSNYMKGIQKGSSRKAILDSINKYIIYNKPPSNLVSKNKESDNCLVFSGYNTKYMMLSAVMYLDIPLEDTCPYIRPSAVRAKIKYNLFYDRRYKIRHVITSLSYP